MHRLFVLLGLAISPVLLGAETLAYEGALYHLYRVPPAQQSSTQFTPNTFAAMFVVTD